MERGGGEERGRRRKGEEKGLLLQESQMYHKGKGKVGIEGTILSHFPLISHPSLQVNVTGMMVGVE